jgi:uncharacterized protein YndB with AHSA1/START domain
MNAMTTTDPIGIRLQRTFAASPRDVYRAWLDPEVIKRWLYTRDRSGARAEVDERVGGRYSVWQMEADGADAGGMEAEIVELVPDERLVFDWRFVGPDRDAGPTYDTRLTVTFRAVEGGTELTLVHERLESLSAGMPDVADQVDVGWGMALDKLPSALAA